MRYVILVFFGACSYGILSTFVKFSYDAGFIVNEVIGSQMFFGALMTWIPTLFITKINASRKQWISLLGVGVTIGLTGILYYTALQYLPASIGIVLMFQFTWIGVLMDAWFKREWPGVDRRIALVLLFVGTFLASGVLESGFAQFTWLGVFFGLLSAFTYALFIHFSETVAAEINPWLRSSIMTTGAVVIAFLVFPPTFLFDGKLFGELSLWGSLLAFFGVLIPTLCFMIGVPRIGAGLATILSATELPMAVLMSSLILQEMVSLWQWAGVVVILVGIAIPQWYERLAITKLGAKGQP